MSKARACKDDILNLNCSADSRPSAHTYQLFENGTLVCDVSNSGVWMRRMSSPGVFVYNCVVNNVRGTSNGTGVTVAVNGKQSFSLFTLL